MTDRDLLARLRQRPFIPFRMALTGGHVSDVRDPGAVTVRPHVAVIRRPAGEEMVSLRHVERLEPLPSMYRPAQP